MVLNFHKAIKVEREKYGTRFCTLNLNLSKERHNSVVNAEGSAKNHGWILWENLFEGNRTSTKKTIYIHLTMSKGNAGIRQQ